MSQKNSSIIYVSSYSFHNEKPYLITGSPGGSTIITSVLRDFNVLDFQMSLEESSKKTEYTFNIPDVLFYEQFDESLLESLKKEKR